VESYSAYGRMQIVKYLLNGTLAFDDALTYCLYSCLQCRRCETMCKSKGQNLDICDILGRGRRLLSDRLAKGGNDAKL
jgi:Fe-S oxidoreductase